MPVSAIHDVKGGTLAQYDQIMEWLSQHVIPVDGLAHISTATPDGFLVFDIWNSAGACDDFSVLLMPLLELAGLKNPAPPGIGRILSMFISPDAGLLPGVVILYSFPGMTEDKYREVLSQVNFSGLPPATRRAHLATETPEGIFVAAIWASEAAFREFEPNLTAAFAATGVDAPPPVVGQLHRVAFNPAAVPPLPA